MTDLSGELARWAYILASTRRTVICHPTREADLRGALHRAGFSQGVRVVPSPACPEGQFMVVKGDPSFREGTTPHTPTTPH